MIVSFTVSSADACTSHAFLLAARVLLDVKAAFFLPSATAEEEDRTCLIAFVGDDMVVVVVVIIIIFGVRREKGYNVRLLLSRVVCRRRRPAAFCLFDVWI